MNAMRAVCDVFMKIGGSVLDDDRTTKRLVPQIAALAEQYRIVLMPGGGRAAKRIKANQRAEGTDFHECWKAGVLCLEVNAKLLASYSTAFVTVASLADVVQCQADRKVAVFAPAGAILNSVQLPRDWEVTTDSMGLHFASAFGAARYVIVSDVHGIYERPPDEDAGLPISQLTVDDLERLTSSKLDSAFPAYFRRYPVPTLVVNGRQPERVHAAICGRQTIGTEILEACAGRKSWAS